MKKIYLIDWNSFIYRMFFALPEFSTSTWVIVNALFGMAKFFVWQITKENPDYVIFIKDAKWDNFRHKIYPEYKATRERMPDNLRTQISLIEEMILKMNFPIIEIENCEADDVIWTLAISLWSDLSNEIFILSWDKDLFSLTTKNVKIYDTMKNKIYDDTWAFEKFEVQSKYIIDYLAIVWDSADNIPWISWFWPKKAIELINKYWTVEQIFEHINDEDFILKSKTLEKLKESYEIAMLSKKLATLKIDIEIENFDLKNYKFNKEKILNNEIIEFFKKYEFFSLLWESEQKELKTFESLNITPILIKSDIDLEKLSLKINDYEEIFLDTETTWLDIINDKIVWVSLWLWSEFYYINHLHNDEQVSKNALIIFFNNLLNSEKTIIWHNLKYDLEMIYSFCENKNTNNETLEKIKQITLF